MRPDLQLVANLIQPHTRVLDLGCGEGELLDNLQREKSVIGYGLDKDEDNIRVCLARGVNVIEQDLDRGLGNFEDNAFDMVIMTETIQSVKEPRGLLEEMLRVGRECVVTFPNFGHWRCRLQLAGQGKMPVSEHLPHRWFNTPNIHLCTFSDFESLCADLHMRVIQRRVVNQQHDERSFINLAPNLFGSYGFYHLGSTT